MALLTHTEISTECLPYTEYCRNNTIRYSLPAFIECPVTAEKLPSNIDFSYDLSFLSLCDLLFKCLPNSRII